MLSEEKIDELLEDEESLEALGIIVETEMGSDDEPYEKKMRYVLNTYLQHPAIVDDIFISLCGWSFETLIKKIKK